MPFEKFVVVIHIFSEPSGVVPGTGEDGRDLSSLFFGSGEGLGCFSKIFAGFFSVKLGTTL